MQVLMTKCVGETWEISNRDRQEVVIKSFRCLGISLPIDGSCDSDNDSGSDDEILFGSDLIAAATGNRRGRTRGRRRDEEGGEE